MHKHKEPWHVDGATIRNQNGEAVAMALGMERERDEIAERIAACVTACQGLTTKRLRQMVPGTLANLLALVALVRKKNG